MISFAEFQKLDLRIGVIQEVEVHPNADKLFVLKLDVGGEVKQSVAGLRGHYTEEELKGRKVVVLNNLEPAKLRGVESQAMVLAATDQGKVVILAPEKDVAVGSPVR